MTIKFFAAVLTCATVLILLAACDQPGHDFSKLGSTGDSELFRLAHRNGCIECHSVGATTIGPSWNAISERYKDVPVEAAKEQLVYSVKNGSRGQWFTMKGGAGMPPLQGRVPDEHIEQLVEFILQLKR